MSAPFQICFNLLEPIRNKLPGGLRSSGLSRREQSCLFVSGIHSCHTQIGVSSTLAQPRLVMILPEGGGGRAPARVTLPQPRGLFGSDCHLHLVPRDSTPGLLGRRTPFPCRRRSRLLGLARPPLAVLSSLLGVEQLRPSRFPPPLVRLPVRTKLVAVFDPVDLGFPPAHRCFSC